MHEALLLLAALLSDPDPPESDLQRFPPPEVVEGWVRFGEAHLAWVEAQAGMDGQRRADWWAYRRCVERRLEAWQMLSWCHWCTGAERRQALRDLRGRLGPRDYAAGRVPPPCRPDAFGRVP